PAPTRHPISPSGRQLAPRQGNAMSHAQSMPLAGETKAKPAILYVDDDPSNRLLFKLLFGREYRVVDAESGADGLRLLEREDGKIPLVVSDHRMPEMTGVPFLTKVRERWPDTIRIIATAYTDVKDLIDAINLGEIYRFVKKPWEKEELQVTLRRAMEAHEL